MAPDFDYLDEKGKHYNYNGYLRKVADGPTVLKAIYKFGWTYYENVRLLSCKDGIARTEDIDTIAIPLHDKRKELNTLYDIKVFESVWVHYADGWRMKSMKYKGTLFKLNGNLIPKQDLINFLKRTGETKFAQVIEEL